MAVSAFKSSSRRSNLTNPSSTSSSSSSASTPSVRSNAGTSSSTKQQTTLRRSRSVSAFSRTGSEFPSSSTSSSSSSDDFLNKRDNPLFWSTGSPPDLEPVASEKPVSVTPLDGAGDGRRGRTVARNSDALVGRKEVGRSLSTVDTGRRNRSVSRCPVSRRHLVNSESEAEQDCSSVKKIGSRQNSDVEVGGDKDKRSSVRARSSSDTVDRKSLRTWSSQHLVAESSNDSALNSSRSHPSTWEDEEKTIKAVCEQMKSSVRREPLESDASASGIYETVRSEVRRAISEIQNDLERAIRRSNTSAISTTNIADIPPDLVNPSAVELVLDIRREYAEKLEQLHQLENLQNLQSQERAKKLRGDLAVEEHRGQELSRILKEVLPDPKTSNVPKSRPTRKASIERRKMSKRLTEEAMAYFDECVSLSTFDSSDFSSQEDAPFERVGVNAYVANSVSSLQESSSASATNSSNSRFKDKQDLGTLDQLANIHVAADLIASSSPKEPRLDQYSPTSANKARDWNSAFSFAHKPTETPDLQQGIQKYIRKLGKDIEKDDDDINFPLLRSNNCDLEEHNLQAAAHSFVFDRVVMRNRIESGNLLLCGGAISVSFSPFASFF